VEAEAVTEGEIYRKMREAQPWHIDHYLNMVYPEDIKKVLDEAHNSMEQAFDEKEEMWLQFKSAYSGESGDYPDSGDFVIWLYEETQKLLAEKKKWFGSEKK
jgi:hypothetical protein